MFRVSIRRNNSSKNTDTTFYVTSRVEGCKVLRAITGCLLSEAYSAMRQETDTLALNYTIGVLRIHSSIAA